MLKKRTTLIFWFLINLLPFVFIKEHYDQFKIAAFLPNEPGLSYIVISYLLILLLEGLIISLAVSLTKKWNIKLLLVTLFLFLIAYTSFIISSWGLFKTSLSFNTLPDIFELINTLDYVNLLRTSSTADIKSLVAILFISIIIPIFIFLSHKSSTSSKAIKITAIEIIITFILILVLGYAGASSFKKNVHLKEMRPIYQNIFTPRFTLFWGKFFLGEKTFPPIEKDFSLEKSYSLKEYGEKVDVKKRKNVLLLYVEALRADVVFKTINDIELTPTINALAKKGANFKRAYAHSPETAYSQSVLITGQYPLKFPTRDYYNDLDYSFTRIYDLLHHVGYRTANLTFEWRTNKRLSKSESLDLYEDIQYEIKDEHKKFLPQKYRSIDDIKKIPTTILDALNVKILNEWIAKNQNNPDKDKPFFGMLYLYSTHFPYNITEGIDTSLFENLDLGQSLSFFNYDKSFSELMLKRYYSTVRYVDFLISQITNSLKEQGLLDNTIIIITGDHGEAFHEHGEVTHSKFMWDETIRVPLIFSDTANLVQCFDTELPVGHIDISPSILKLLSLPEYGGFQGSSLFCERPNKSQKGKPLFASIQGLRTDNLIIDWPWKLVVDKKRNLPKLFNLSKDSKELKNVYSEQTEIAKKLEKNLADFERRQFSYYLSDKSFRLNYFPPKY